MAEPIMIRHGVEKTIKRSGKVGGETPKPGQLCYVHYSGMLSDGTVFDSSRTAGRGPLQFNVGQGQVIPGWDLTVATMLKGEKCVVKIAPEYAYGDSGAGNVIPPNATLTFQMELIDFTDGMGMSNLTIFLLCCIGFAILWHTHFLGFFHADTEWTRDTPHWHPEAPARRVEH